MNKRVVSILLVLIMVISNCTVVLGADKVTGTSTDGSAWTYGKATDSGGTTTTNSKDVNASFTVLESGTGIYSVDITWGSLQYSYDGAGTWSESTHVFSGFTGGSWTFDEGANKITFTNHSNKKVKATYGFTQNNEFVTGSLKTYFIQAGCGLTLGSLALGDTDIEQYTTLTIEGTPTTVKAISGKIGSVTITLSPIP